MRLNSTALIQFMDEQRLNQSQFAKLIDCTPSSVTHYMKGDRFPQGDIILRIINVTGLSIEELIDE